MINAKDISNCPNCGAPITEKKCPYCGTRFYNVSTIEDHPPKITGTKRQLITDQTYTIKRGDTLWDISKKFYGDGAKWTIIYNANKDIIEATAKKHGKSSSRDGHLIYPGVTLTIPGEGVVDKLAREVIQGVWGRGSVRKERLEAAGYDSVAVQARVNQLMSGQGGSRP